MYVKRGKNMYVILNWEKRPGPNSAILSIVFIWTARWHLQICVFHVAGTIKLNTYNLLSNLSLHVQLKHNINFNPPITVRCYDFHKLIIGEAFKTMDEMSRSQSKYVNFMKLPILAYLKTREVYQHTPLKPKGNITQIKISI